MGIVNMMIVIPMFIESLSFGKIYDLFLDSTPGNAIRFAGFLLLLAAVATRFIQIEKEQFDAAAPAGH